MSGSRILGTIHGDGDDVYVSLPLQVLAAAGINVGDVVEVSIIDKTIRLAPLDRSEPDTVLDGLVASVHEDAHALSMSRFMMAKNRDLEISDSGQQISPRDWLIAGYDPELVMVMLPDL